MQTRAFPGPRAGLAVHCLSLSPVVAARLYSEQIPRMPVAAQAASFLRAELPASSTPGKFQEVILKASEEAGIWEFVSKRPAAAETAKITHD